MIVRGEEFIDDCEERLFGDDCEEFIDDCEGREFILND